MAWRQASSWCISWVPSALQGGECIPGAAAICTLLGVVAAFSGLTFGRPILRAALIIVLLALVAWNNGRDPYKLSYPCLEVRPDQSNLVVYDPASAIERWRSLRARGTSEPETSGPAPGLLDDRRC